jgi:hypothetical protein
MPAAGGLPLFFGGQHKQSDAARVTLRFDGRMLWEGC